MLLDAPDGRFALSIAAADNDVVAPVFFCRALALAVVDIVL